jgi:RNA polymerase sigma-70 factor (ECF subfamily)
VRVDSDSHPHPSPARPPRSLSVNQFSDAYDEHRTAVFRIAARVCGSVMAEDVTQEVFLHLWCHCDRFDAGRGTLRNYLLAIARNTAVDRVRSDTSRRAREERTSGPPASARDGIEIEVDRRDDAVLLAAAVDCLPVTERDALVTAFWGERTYRQTALQLDRPEGTTKSQIRSGLRQLRVVLADSLDDREHAVPA